MIVRSFERCSWYTLACPTDSKLLHVARRNYSCGHWIPFLYLLQEEFARIFGASLALKLTEPTQRFKAPCRPPTAETPSCGAHKIPKHLGVR